jgi:hypothetical protein
MTPTSPHSSQYAVPPEGQEPHQHPYPPPYPGALDGQQPHVAYAQDAAVPQIDNINEVLQAQQALQANHALNPPLPQQSKPNRLRKACDSCSARKVKVASLNFHSNTFADLSIVR